MRVLVTGGAGFVGCNVADHFLSEGHEVVVFDSLERPGTEKNVAWLGSHGGRLTVLRGDVTSYEQVARAVRGSHAVLHLAAQVAVTTSVDDPRRDFEVNALGTFNVLEAVRLHAPSAALIYASTNKVYGGLEHVAVAARGRRYEYADGVIGISEREPLDFHSPYGCSKGAADQYVRDYGRIYGLKTIVFRQSCIYGPRQFGHEDQGWVAWFAIAAARGEPITIYGDGKQVRDVLYISDLVAAFRLALARADSLRGAVYNIGGGPGNVSSLLELIAQLEAVLGRSIRYRFADWRPGDQRVYVSDIRRAEAELSWTPRVDVTAGVRQLVQWVSAEFAAPRPAELG